MTKLYFITHPSVTIDSSVPIDQWNLSEKGLEAANKLLEHDFIKEFGVIYSSAEPKAITVAEMVSSKINVPITNKVKDLGEIRGRTFIPPEIFVEATKNWFDNPTQNINGWESRDDTQKRIVDCVSKIMASENGKIVAIVGHGGTGTLLKCHIKGIEPLQTEDQPGQGCYFIADWDNQKLIQDWVKFSS